MAETGYCKKCEQVHEMTGSAWDCVTSDDVDDALWNLYKDSIKDRYENFMSYCFEKMQPNFCWICGEEIEGVERNCPHCKYRLGLDGKLLFDNSTITFSPAPQVPTKEGLEDD